MLRRTKLQSVQQKLLSVLTDKCFLVEHDIDEHVDFIFMYMYVILGVMIVVLQRVFYVYIYFALYFSCTYL